MSRILIREGARPQVSGFFFKALIQSVLIFGAETWVVTPRMSKSLGGFQNQVAIRLTIYLLRKTTEGAWRYTSAAAETEEAGLLTMEESQGAPRAALPRTTSSRSARFRRSQGSLLCQ